VFLPTPHQNSSCTPSISEKTILSLFKITSGLAFFESSQAPLFRIYKYIPEKVSQNFWKEFSG